MDKICRHLYISGRVQGVGFRAYIYRNALKLKVCGWVKNLSNGGVEAVFAGERTKVLKLIELARNGPEWSMVSNIKVINENFSGEYSGFSVK
jgi:acylphosphatase